MKKASFYRPRGKEVICTACVRYCQIPAGKVGFCQSRLNRDGVLYSLIYGIANGVQVDPIEKKPLYHFFPGSQVLSIGSYGCNFRCRQCLNSWCSYGLPAINVLKGLRSNKNLSGIRVQPSELVRLARETKCAGIAFTYNEPAIWPEFVYDTASLAKKAKLFTCFISNGSWSLESLAKLNRVIDSANIDFKAYFAKTYLRMGAYYPKIMDNMILALKKYKIHLELTTLVIPGVNDSVKELTQIARFIKTKLDPNIPWHLSRFDPKLSPDKVFKKIPYTSKKTMQKAYQIAKKEGLKHVYLWAPPKDNSDSLYAITDSYCPSCKELLVKRDAWTLRNMKVDKKGRCLNCGTDMYMRV